MLYVPINVKPEVLYVKPAVVLYVAVNVKPAVLYIICTYQYEASSSIIYAYQCEASITVCYMCPSM